MFPFVYSFILQLWSWVRIHKQGRCRRPRSERGPGCFWLEQGHWSAFFWEGGSARADVYVLKAKYWGEWGFQFWRMHLVWGVSAAVRSSVEIFRVDMPGTEGTGLNWTYWVEGDSKWNFSGIIQDVREEDQVASIITMTEETETRRRAFKRVWKTIERKTKN